jgi:hypothetical protein
LARTDLDYVSCGVFVIYSTCRGIIVEVQLAECHACRSGALGSSSRTLEEEVEGHIVKE